MDKLIALKSYLNSIPIENWIHVLYHMCSHRNPSSIWPYSLGYELNKLIEEDVAVPKDGALQYIDSLLKRY